MSAATETESAPVREGDVLAGKYRVEKILGAGGMGVVVAATHLQLDQRVALKFLLPDMAKNPEVVARFTREARAAARISGQHVARVIDVGALETGAPYMVMEYLDGKDLAAVLAERGPLPFEEAVGYVLQACEALAQAHAAGIVHRDVKPANLFLARQPGHDAVIKVLDFGISRALNPTDGALTKTSAILGSPFYMSPEQLSSPRTADHRADLWSLGVALYELLTGKLPFDGDTMPELVAAILANAPAPLDVARPGLPVGLVAAAMRCLVKDPAQRYANIAELAAALAPFGGSGGSAFSDRVSKIVGVPLSAPAIRVAPPSLEGSSGGVAADRSLDAWGAGATAPGVTAGDTAASAQPKRRRSTVAVVAAIAALAVTVVGAGLLVSAARKPSAASAAAPDTSAATGLAPPVTATAPAMSIEALAPAIAEAPAPTTTSATSASAPIDPKGTPGAAATATPAQRPPTHRTSPPTEPKKDPLHPQLK